MKLRNYALPATYTLYNCITLEQMHEYSQHIHSGTLCNIYDLYTVYRRIVNTPATAKLAIVYENKQADRFPFFSASQKKLKINLIR